MCSKALVDVLVSITHMDFVGDPPVASCTAGTAQPGTNKIICLPGRQIKNCVHNNFKTFSVPHILIWYILFVAYRTVVPKTSETNAGSWHHDVTRHFDAMWCLAWLALGWEHRRSTQKEYIKVLLALIWDDLYAVFLLMYHTKWAPIKSLHPSIPSNLGYIFSVKSEELSVSITDGARVTLLSILKLLIYCLLLSRLLARTKFTLQSFSLY